MKKLFALLLCLLFVCIGCAMATETTPCPEEEHSWADQHESNETHHWQSCTVCGATQRYESHINSCVDNEKCSTCGAAYTGSVAGKHVGDSSGYGHNETHHWVPCALCDEYAVYRTHFRTCISTTNACVCGFSGNDVPVEHFYKEGKCTRCGEEEVHEHSWNVLNNIPATCTEAGLKEFVCKGCGGTKRETLAPSGHSWSTIGKQEATCTEDGFENFACNNVGCEATRKEVLQAKHNMELRYDEYQHWYVCTK